MVVPNAHVTRLETVVENGVGRVVAIHLGGEPTRSGSRRTPPSCSRRAPSRAPGRRSSRSRGPGNDLIGTNLMGDMTSNLTVAIPRRELSLSPSGDLQASALYLKGRRAHADGTVSTFHLQITAAGLKGWTRPGFR